MIRTRFVIFTFVALSLAGCGAYRVDRAPMKSDKTVSDPWVSALITGKWLNGWLNGCAGAPIPGGPTRIYTFKSDGTLVAQIFNGTTLSDTKQGTFTVNGTAVAWTLPDSSVSGTIRRDGVNLRVGNDTATCGFVGDTLSPQ